MIPEQRTGPRDRRPLTAALAANAVSITGNALTIIGVPWFVLQSTGSASRAGLVAFCATLPVLVSALFGGPVIDRVGRRRISIASDLACGVAIGSIPLLHFAGLLEFWLLCVLMAVTGLCHAPGETARSSLVPSLAELAGTPLSRAASFYDGVSRGARMTGAALGGVLIALLGAEPVLLLDAATFALSALLMAAGVRGVPAAEPAPKHATRTGYRAELIEGYRYLLSTPLLLAVVLMVMVTNGLDQGWSAVLLPAHADRELGGPVDLGLVSALWGVGAVLGTVLYGAFGHRFRRWPVFTVAFLLIGGPRYAVAAFTSDVVPLAVVLPLVGIGAGMLNPILSTVVFETVPEELRSRVLGVTTAGVLMTTPLGGLAAGFLVDGIGLAPTFLALGGVYVLVTLSPLVFPVWRRMDPDGSAREGQETVSSSGPSRPSPAPAASRPRR